MKDDLYHQAILDLARRGREQGRLEAPRASVTVDNPLCGDRVTLDLTLASGRVDAIGHRVRGCLLCQAAATVIGNRAIDATPEELRTMAARLAEAIASGSMEGLWSELTAFAPVHAHKSRHDCVLLPFEALAQALDQAEAS